MPIYEYLCPKGHLTEQFVSLVKASRRQPCRLCGTVAVRILSPTPGFVKNPAVPRRAK